MKTNPSAQWTEPRGSTGSFAVIQTLAWQEDGSGWWVASSGGEALSLDANSFVVPGSSSEAVTALKTVLRGGETLLLY